jgi:hypothetical protein
VDRSGFTPPRSMVRILLPRQWGSGASMINADYDPRVTEPLQAAIAIVR